MHLQLITMVQFDRYYVAPSVTTADKNPPGMLETLFTYFQD
jgi:hypothetical protein